MKLTPLLALLLLLMSCAKPEEKVVTFAVGGAPAEFEFWDELIKEFESKTAVRVELLRQPTDTDQRRQGLVISLAARQKKPDVFLMDIVWLAQFAASDWLEPLEGYIDTKSIEDTKGQAGVRLDSFFPNIVNLADRYAGNLVALPVYADGGLLYYREDLLKDMGARGPPETWEELVSDSVSVQESMRRTQAHFFGFLWQGAQYEGLVCNFLEFAGSNGGGITLSDGKIIIDTPENLAAVRFMVDLIYKWRISPPSTFIEMREEQVRTAFEQGNALFERNWPYAWTIHQAKGSKVRGKIGVAPLPHFPGGKSTSTLGGWHIGISRYSEQKELSWKLIQYVVSYETQKKLALKLGWPPGREDIYEDPVVLSDLPHFARLKTVFENARPRPTLPYYTQLSEILQHYLNATLAGALTPEAALASAQRDGQRIVERYGNVGRDVK